jgi:hypothetical protein
LNSDSAKAKFPFSKVPVKVLDAIEVVGVGLGDSVGEVVEPEEVTRMLVVVVASRYLD